MQCWSKFYVNLTLWLIQRYYYVIYMQQNVNYAENIILWLFVAQTLTLVHILNYLSKIRVLQMLKTALYGPLAIISAYRYLSVES